MNDRTPSDLGDYLLLVLAAIAVVVLTSFPDTLEAEAASALCTTDSECALFCPPDDAECDGGPND